MINEEKKINDMFGKENPFSLPEGYFDNLTSQVMDRLPAQEVKVHFWQRLEVRKIAAAVAAVLVLGGGAYIGLRHAQPVSQPIAHASHALLQSAQSASAKQYTSDDENFDEMADYTMMDSQDFYASLIAEN